MARGKAMRKRGARAQQRLPDSVALLPQPSLKTWRFERSENIGALTIPTTTDGAFSWSWTLADLPSISEITNLFQEYKVTQIALSFTWDAAAGSTSVFYPTMYLVDQTSGVTPPSNIDAFLQRPFKKVVFNQSKTSHSVAFVPHVRAGVQQSGGSVTGHTVQPCPWIASSSTGVMLNGAGAWITNYNTATAPGTIRLVARFSFAVRGML